MPPIRQLPPSLIAKIAAGEIIEKPAYAIKELIENALDAKATNISIYLEDSGLKKIQVTDNGIGMVKADLHEAWKPHTTSKLSPKDTLVGIKYLGFRGEALSSLAAVSDLSIKSRTKKSPLGNLLEIKNNKITKSQPIGMPKGTVVIAENLFSTTPARKKFLKSKQSELRYITDLVTYYSISFPKVYFSLKHNKRIILDLSPTENVQERLYKLFPQFDDLLIPFSNEESYVRVWGFIAKPQLYTSNTSKQFLFVNNRKVSDKVISLAVKESYGTMLESNTFPIFVLFITTPYEMVDINIHPRKEQISFFDNTYIFSFVKTTILQALQENNITFQNLSWKRRGVGSTDSFAGRLLKDKVLKKESLKPIPESTPMQLNCLYIISQTKNGYIIVDQHAAHERIIFEKLQKEFLLHKKNRKSFQLKEPTILHLSSSEKILLEEHKKTFKSLGFGFVKHVVTHVPFLFQDRKIDTLIKELLENLEEHPLKTIDQTSIEMLSFLACRAAIKAGESLNPDQMKDILAQLENTPNNATCPHGRPTHIFTHLSQINTLFRRS